jgi:hypothetical protein
MLRSSGGVVAPLLAGFSLATITLLVTSTTRPRLGEWAAAAFAAAVGFLLFSMQVAPLALSHSVTPQERIGWYPEAAKSSPALEYARLEHEVDSQLVFHYWRLAGGAYDLGLLSFLTGLVLVLYPRTWTIGSGIAFGIAVAALMVELRWTSGTWLPRLRWTRIVKPHDQALSSITLSELDTVSRSSYSPSQSD